MDKIILLVAPSGAGKTTVANILCEQYGFKQVVSYTTRKPRYKNELGHIFVTCEQFNCLTNICAYTEFDGNKYCATSEQVDNADIYIIDKKGIQYFKEHYVGAKKPIVVFMSISEKCATNRMRIRGDTDEMIARRLENDRIEFKNVADIADCVISNYNSPQTALKIKSILEKED